MQKDINSQIRKLKQILNECDLIGIFPFQGGPQDEYDCLLSPIVKLLMENKDSMQLSSLLLKELQDHFGISVNLEHRKHIEESANKIYKWWNNGRNHG